MNAIRLPFSIWWLRWLLFARFSLMLPSLCWLAGWMVGWLDGWLTGIAVVTVCPVLFAIHCYAWFQWWCRFSVPSWIIPINLHHINDRCEPINWYFIWQELWADFFFFRLLSRFTSFWILSSLCCWMQCIRYFCNHRRSCTFIWYCISFRRFASRFDAPSCICIDWNYALFAGFSHQTNFSIQVGAFHSLLLVPILFFLA